MLGGLRARVDDGPPLRFPTRRAAGVFAYLAHHAHRLFHRDVLTSLYWGDRPERRARKSFRTCLWRIRSVVEGGRVPRGTFLQVEGQRVGLGGDPRGEVWVDARRFEEALASPSSGSPEDERRLSRGVELYRGEFLEGRYERWCQEERERLHLLLLEGIERLFRHHLMREEYSRAVQRGQGLLRADPFREHVHRELMLCFYRMGSRPLALRQYEKCEEILRSEMDLEPMPETRELRDRIRNGSLRVG